MATKTLVMTEGSLGKKILLFSLPLMLSNLLQILFTMADVAVVGRFAGALALGAVGSTTTLVMLFTGFLIGFSTGINVLVARFCGARDVRNTKETIHTAALLCLCLGLTVMGIGQLLIRPMLTLLNTKEDLIEGATLYLRIYFSGIPALALFNFGNAVFSAVGNTKKPLLFLSSSGAINVILNLIFVVGLHMSVAGVALASIHFPVPVRRPHPRRPPAGEGRSRTSPVLATFPRRQGDQNPEPGHPRRLPERHFPHC